MPLSILPCEECRNLQVDSCGWACSLSRCILAEVTVKGTYVLTIAGEVAVNHCPSWDYEGKD